MAEMPLSKFHGTAEDYLNWFNGVEFEKVVLPKSQTDGKGLQVPETEQDSCSFIDTSAYMDRKHGQDYAAKYKKEFEALPLVDTKQHSKVWSVEEDTMTESLLNEDGVNAAQVYLHYNFCVYNQDSTLPVFDDQKLILKEISNYQVVVIQGETGCGKSTQIPQFILDDAAEKNVHCNIVVTQPRKIAAISLARRVCTERNWVLGKLVGYQVGLDKRTDIDTRLVYVTAEVLVQTLINQRSLDKFTHIILDEVHERSAETDFAILLVKKLLRSVSPRVKIILMSATIDTFKFSEYFASPVTDQLVPAPVISIGKRTRHKIMTFYLEDLRVICRDRPTIIPKLPRINPGNPSIDDDMYKFVVEMISCFDILEENTEKMVTTRGAVLVFLPGLFQIECLIDHLGERAERYKWQLFPLHSSITHEEQQLAFSTQPKGFRKIILSTNIAESSVTITDIKYVIDFCLTKVLTYDSATNYTSLKMDWSSQASCQQKAGRCGRVSSGRVYRLIPQSFFRTLPLYSTPELCRIPLSHLVLKTKVLNMGEPQSLLALALDPPNLVDIHRTILTLKQMGALAVKSNNEISSLDGNLTFLGEVIVALPLDPRLAKLIVMGYLLGCLRECIIIAAGLSLRGIHAHPFRDELNAYLSKVSWSYGSFSDCIAVLNAYDLWQSLQLRGKFIHRGGQTEKHWARHSYVDLVALREVQTLVNELTSRLQRFKIEPQVHNPINQSHCLILKICIASAFFPHYFKRYIPDNHEEEICRELNGHDPFKTVVVGGLPPDTNIVYDQQIRQLFQECSQNLRISYEGSRAFIQFPRLSGSSEKENHFKAIPGDCPTTMHMALKMHQITRIQKGFFITCYSPEESERKLKEALGYNVQSNSSLKLRKDPQQSTLFTAVRVTQPSVCRLKPPILPTQVDHAWKVYVSHVETAGHFWVVSNEMGETFKIKDETRDLTNIQSCINSAISNDEAPPLSLEGITPGHVCLAKYKDIDGLQSYYRARIEEVHCDSNVLVYFVDYGNTEFVDGEDLRALPVGLTDVNMKAMECMLAELKPAPKYGEAWGEEVTNWVQIQIENQYCLLEIYSIVHGVLRVKVLKKHEGKEISLSDELISKGYAVCADESYLSKQNRGLRAIYSSHLQDISTSNACTLTSAVSSLSLNCDSKSSVFEGKEEKIFLRGPYSPLLLKFMPLTRPLNYSSVHVEMSSVNSTALDLEPQSPRSRLMVASFAGLNSCESMVILRNTTLMPPIPGLLSLCLLLFCPVAELRVNNECTRYTGALIGLGYDEENGRAIYPDEDIELEFDVNFTQNDLITINMVRYLMDAALQEKDEISSHMLISIRKKLRKLIISLLEEGRAYKDPEPHQQLYRWNMVPKEDVLPPIAVELADEAGGLVFPLHCGIVLRPENCPEKLRNKLSELKNLQARLAAEESTPYTEVNRTCPLCLVPLKSLLNLELHMASTAHMYEERRLEKSSSSMVQDDEV